ncbi:hypothetical protein H0H81_006743, partial [Sphagnurus paluster]
LLPRGDAQVSVPPLRRHRQLSLSVRQVGVQHGGASAASVQVGGMGKGGVQYHRV